MSSLARATGSYTFDWDGWSPTGKILPDSANVTAACSETSLFGEKHIITTGNTPIVSGLKTDPYVMEGSYGQITRRTYTLSRFYGLTCGLARNLYLPRAVDSPPGGCLL